jgi:hypothetical protein
MKRDSGQGASSYDRGPSAEGIASTLPLWQQQGFNSYADWLATQGTGQTAEAEDPTIPTDPVTGLASTNQYHIPGASNFYSNLPSNQFNQSTNMLTLADGGRTGYAGGKDYKSNQGLKYLAQVQKGSDVDDPFLNDMDAYIKFLKKRGVSEEEIYDIIVLEQDMSDYYKTPDRFEDLKPIAEPFYPHKFEDLKPIAEPFYPHKFENLKPELMAQGGRTGYAGGGITDLRQGYFLGKLVKGITKPFKSIKKIAKSPIGLAALSMFAPQLMGKFIPGMANTGWKGNFLSKLGTSFKKNPFPWISGAAALGGAYTAMNPEEDKDGYDYAEKDKWLKYFSDIPTDSIRFATAADGGRIGYAGGKDHRAAALSAMYGEEDDEEFAYGGSAGLPPVSIAPEGFNSQSFPDDESTGIAQSTPTLPSQMPRPKMDPRMMAQQGIMKPKRGLVNEPGGYAGYETIEDEYDAYVKEIELGLNEYADTPMSFSSFKKMIESAYATGGRVGRAEGGLMDLGGMEKDYRAEGGFVPLGGEERADDVPARLSKNEFVFTADAVRNAGGGDIDKGAEVMENLMENLEAGGKVSQQSQGLEGAREMFATQQRLGEVL